MEMLLTFLAQEYKGQTPKIDRKKFSLKMEEDGTKSM